MMNTTFKEHIFTDRKCEYSLFFPAYFSEIYKRPSKALEISDYTMIKRHMCQRFPDKKSIFVDVGANSGLCCVPIAIEGYFVIAFEPVQINYDSLVIGIEKNRLQNHFLLERMALSETAGIKKIFVPSCPDNSSFNEQVAISNMKDKTINVKEEVQAIDFDSYIAKSEMTDRIRCIKIDVQGFEFDVLKGMNKFLTAGKNIDMIIEWDQKHTEASGFNLNDIRQFLETRGFVEFPWRYGDKLFSKRN